MQAILSEAGPVLVFMACVALATYAQNLTGFAFSLILLGLVSVFHVASVSDTANAATVLSLINAWTYFRARPGVVPWRLMKPALNGSTVGVIAGLMLLTWLSGGAVNWLRGLLGVSILGCALLLVLQGRPQPAVSGRTSFAVIGGLSGVLGGLFSSSGPPIVFHMYRQPLERELVRRALLLMFAFNSLVRLVIVLPTGHFSWRAALLAACAMPVVYGVTRLHHRLPNKLQPRTLKWLVGGLLAAAGSTLVASAWLAIAQA
ncbi:putative membrane protein YfcA [Variovorax paradoxus]|uniref:Probable membrane transporter protein n=1 Tax=Variovorax paradoxus TaxID=34073 RepID=A0AAE3Y0R8_VARPD|nr:TSUP family transporter [Variovorax paradoxus]MDR6427268.1 putative membrane protein YfcA [Variovorax paradoxus]MDR6454429.1 putative membrane protein YfcA [Variovorax paradoxus]